MILIRIGLWGIAALLAVGAITTLISIVYLLGGF